MGRLLWIGLVCCLAAPAVGAELRCGEGGGEVVGTDAEVVLVAVDDRVHALRPDAEAGEEGSADDFCVTRPGLVAIVLPAPKPGPDDEHPSEAIELPEGLDALGPPIGPDGLGSPGADDAQSGEGSGSDGTATGQEPAPTLARTRSGALPPDLLSDEMRGCRAAPAGDGAAFAFILFGLLGLRRKRGAR